MPRETIAPRPVFVIVDDLAMIRLTLRRAIGKACPDALVYSAATVADTRKVIHDRQPTAIIADYYLTDGTGLDMLESAVLVEPPIPVVIMSVDLAIADAAVAAGAASFLAKPFDLPQLVAVLHQLQAPVSV